MTKPTGLHNSLKLLPLGDGNPGGSNILQEGQGQEKTSSVSGYTESQGKPRALIFPGKG